MYAKLRSLWRNITRRERLDRALDEELAGYLELLIAEKIGAGTAPDEARRLARAECGVTSVTEAVRDVRAGASLSAFTGDVRHAVRALRRTPGFTLATVLTLAVGLGAATTIFTLVNSALLRPLPFVAADRLALITEFSSAKTTRTGAPYPDVLEWQRQNSSFATMAGYWNVPGDGVVFGSAGDPERLHYTIVSNQFFPVLGVRPALGRGFAGLENIPGQGNVFIASDGLWRRALGARADALGQRYLIDGTMYTLVGVLPPGIQFPDDQDIWLPLGALDGFPLDRVSHQFWVVGRLKPGVSFAHAQAEMSAIQKRLGVAFPVTDADWKVTVRPLVDEYVGDIRTSLLVLFGAVGFILLIAAASVANLTLTRALTREREFAIRTALGASRRRLIRHCLIESGLITGAGLTLALAFAAVTHKALFAFTTLGTSRVLAPRFDLRVWIFGALVATLTCLVVGLTPAWYALRKAPQDALRGTPGSGSGGRGRAGQRLRNGLVVTELALTLLLLAGAGLMARSFVQLRHVDPGFNPDRLLTLQVALPDASYPGRQRRDAFYGELLTHVARLPGVRAAASSDELPLKLGTDFGESFNIVGRPILDWSRAPAALNHPVSASYFATMQIPIVRGRGFQPGDSNVMVIDRAMAELFWPGIDPLGQQVATLDAPHRPMTIVGMVGNVRSTGLDRSGVPEMYFPGSGWSHLTLEIRTDGDPMALVRSVRRTVTALDRRVPVYRVAAMTDLMAESLGTRRFDLIVLAAFAAFALLIAAIGVGGVLAFTVSRSTHDIGIRNALGAGPRDILRSVGGPAARLVGFGVAVGLVSAAGLTRFMTSIVYGVAPIDALSFGGATVLVVIVALGACYLPIRRALRVDPLLALRQD
jgi:putative ABC transport system permease protein